MSKNAKPKIFDLLIIVLKENNIHEEFTLQQLYKLLSSSSYENIKKYIKIKDAKYPGKKEEYRRVFRTMLLGSTFSLGSKKKEPITLKEAYFLKFDLRKGKYFIKKDIIDLPFF